MITPIERLLLACLMRNAHAVIPREKLIHETWRDESESASNRVDVYIRRLRQKIEAHPKDRDPVQGVQEAGHVSKEDTAAQEHTG
jgi:two-component system, OmpR family, response regulator RegX3